MANPYIVGRPVPYSHLYGRDELIQKCYHDVNNNIWLLGRRRSGKTSVLYAIEDFALEKKEWFPVYITLEDCFSDADIKKSFLRAFRSNLKKFGLEAEYQPLTEAHDFFDLVDDVCRWLNEREIGLLLLLDEIEKTETLGEEGNRLVTKLRGMHGKRELRLRTIIAAARVLRIEKRLVTSEFIGLFNVEYIGAITEAEARKLILQEKNIKVKIQATAEVIDKILTVTAHEPYLCQYLCHELYQQNNSLRAPTDTELTQFDVNVNTILASDYAYLEEKEKEILRRIAQCEQVDPSSVPAELIQLGYVKQVNHQYRMGNHFLETWLKANVIQPSLSLSDESSKQSNPPVNQQSPPPAKLSKPADLFFSIFIPASGLGLIMVELAILMKFLSNFESVLLVLATAILGFAILIYAGRSTDIIGETTFFRLFSQILKQLPLLSKLIPKENGNSG